MSEFIDISRTICQITFFANLRGTADVVVGSAGRGGAEQTA